MWINADQSTKKMALRPLSNRGAETETAHSFHYPQSQVSRIGARTKRSL